MHSKAYLDSNATTMVDPLVATAMIEDLTSFPANPSSQHALGKKAKQVLSQARETISSYLQVKPSEILFTSGGTESMNLLIRGIATPGCHIITSNIEHSCVQKTLQDMEKLGYSVSYLPAGLDGSCAISLVKEAITPATKLLVFSAVNSETGVKQDISLLANLALQCNIPLVIDAVALLGKEIFTIPNGVTAMGFSAHKFHGPKGVGFIFLRSKTKITPLLTGGGQEYGLRSGTENLTGIVGCAKAVELLNVKLPSATKHMEALRDHFESALLKAFPFLQVNGKSARICNVSNIAFAGIDAETLLIHLDRLGIYASQGSACASGALEPSRILLQMGLSSSLVKSSVRFSLNRNTTLEEISYTLSVLLELIPKLRSISST
jgi:cysteine desulfurase